MNGLLRKNLIALNWDNYPFETANRITLGTSRSGLPVPILNDGLRESPLHSLFDPRREGEKLLRNYGKSGMKIFIGLGGAYHIHPFSEKSRILIIEPDRQLAGELLSLMDYSDLFSRENVNLLVAPAAGDTLNWLLENYIPLLDGSLDLIPLRSYQSGREPLFDLYSEEVNRALQLITTDCSTQKKLGRQWQRNILTSLDEAFRNPFDPSLFSQYERVIIAAAGPGLEAHGARMKNRDGGTLLLAVDTALPALIEMGIEPDSVITIDPQAIGYLHFMKKMPARCSVLADWGTPVHKLSLRNPLFYFSSSHPLCRYFMERGGIFLPLIREGGNVTQRAIALAEYCGITKVTLIGADFAYPRKKPYCRGSYFTQWHDLHSVRLDPLESRLISFVLDRSHQGTSLLLKSYEEQLGSFLLARKGRIQKVKDGRWEIELQGRERPSLIQKKEILPRQLIEEYGKEIQKISDGFPSPLTGTLIPLGYGFLQRNDGPGALKRAAEYTLDLLSDHFS